VYQAQKLYYGLECTVTFHVDPVLYCTNKPITETKIQFFSSETVWVFFINPSNHAVQ